MKIKIIILLTLITSSTFACDICGCFMGITPYDNQSNFGVYYRYRSYNGYTGQKQQFFPSNSSFLPIKNQTNFSKGQHNGLQSDYEIYRTTELRGKYFLQKRWEFNAIIPYLINSERYNNQTSTISGLGDITVFSGYHLIRKLESKLNQRLISGLGIKIPTGNHTIKSDAGINYSTPFQPGTGSTDAFIYANYILGYKTWGFSINSSYKVNGENAQKESIANSTTNFLSVFKKIDIKKNLKIIPSLQASYEYSKGEKYNGILTGEHETNNLLTGVGLDIFVKNIAFNASMQTNTWSAQTDHPLSSGRLVLGLTYNLNQLYYAIK